MSAFNALTLSPALAALLLRPKKEGKKKNLLERFFASFNRGFDKFTNGYTRVAGFFTRKLIITLVILGVITLVCRLPAEKSSRRFCT